MNKSYRILSFFNTIMMKWNKRLCLLCTCNTSSKFFKWLLMVSLIQLWADSRKILVSAHFNLFLDRREFQKLHGISSDIYYILEGVVNEYALNFLVTVPPDVDDLTFSWQALTKRAVHYDMMMDYTDFYALLPPVTNIASNGRVPHNLQTFKVSIPCSGRSNSEVSVIIRMNFQVKHSKTNTTSISIKRNKICLFKETIHQKSGLQDMPLPTLFPAVEVNTNTNYNPNSEFPMTNATLQFQIPTPSLLLAGLLGGCALTASLVFVIFFICVRRKLISSQRSELYNSDSSSNNASPACLLRQSQLPRNNSQVWKHLNSEKLKSNGTISSRSASQNSYVTIASFWNDILSSGSNNRRRQAKVNIQLGVPQSQQIKCLQEEYNCHSEKISSRGSDVSPYAYAHIIPKPPTTAPPTSKIDVPISPSLGQRYSKSRGQNIVVNSDLNNSYENISFNQNYSPVMCTFNPKSNFALKTGDICSTDESLSKSDPIQKYNSPSVSWPDYDGFVQAHGFQCCKGCNKECNVGERFL